MALCLAWGLGKQEAREQANIPALASTNAFTEERSAEEAVCMHYKIHNPLLYV